MVESAMRGTDPRETSDSCGGSRLAPQLNVPTFHRRHLPHWQADEPIPYFVTWRLREGQSLLEEKERDLVTAALRHFDGGRYELLAWVVMPDHVHVILVLAGEHTLASVLHSWKSYTAHILRRASDRPAPVWQDESFDRIIRSDEELLEKITYIENNPRKRDPGVVDYRWMWHRWQATGETPALPINDRDRRDACPTDERP
jgi:REP element-mobilizing transposase RayT